MISKCPNGSLLASLLPLVFLLIQRVVKGIPKTARFTKWVDPDPVAKRVCVYIYSRADLTSLVPLVFLCSNAVYKTDGLFYLPFVGLFYLQTVDGYPIHLLLPFRFVFALGKYQLPFGVHLHHCIPIENFCDSLRHYRISSHGRTAFLKHSLNLQPPLMRLS